MNESQKYHRLMLALHSLADGMALTDRISDTENDGYGLKFGIDEILATTVFVSRKTFDSDDIATVKAAFARVGKRYPGDIISHCVGVLLGLRT